MAHKPEDYIGIKLWHGTSQAYYWQNLQALAAHEDAPIDAIYRVRERVWASVSDLGENHSFRKTYANADGVGAKEYPLGLALTVAAKNRDNKRDAFDKACNEYGVTEDRFIKVFGRFSIGQTVHGYGKQAYKGDVRDVRVEFRVGSVHARVRPDGYIAITYRGRGFKGGRNGLMGCIVDLHRPHDGGIEQFGGTW